MGAKGGGSKERSLRAIAALIVLAALLFAPACGPLCTMQDCNGKASSQNADKHCHGISIAGDEAARASNAFAPCLKAELQLARARSTDGFQLEKDLAANSTANAHVGQYLPEPEIVLWAAEHPPGDRNRTSHASGVLRI